MTLEWLLEKGRNDVRKLVSPLGWTWPPFKIQQDVGGTDEELQVSQHTCEVCGQPVPPKKTP